MLLEEITNRYLDRDGEKGGWGKTSQMGEKATKIPFSSISLRRYACTDEHTAWIIKVFYIISSRELHEFHSETRHSVSFWYKTEIPMHKAGGVPEQRSLIWDAVSEITALLTPIIIIVVAFFFFLFFLAHKAFSTHITHTKNTTPPVLKSHTLIYSMCTMLCWFEKNIHA